MTDPLKLLESSEKAISPQASDQGGALPPPPASLPFEQKRLLNLKSWKKGQTGNPLNKNMGRPKIADRLEKWGKLKISQAVLEKFKVMFPNAVIRDADDAWTQRVMMAAIQGESWAATFIAERREGKIKQGVEMSGKMGIDLHDISDDELHRRIADAQRRAAALTAGEAAPAVPE
jgi:hypothetical protein